MGWMLGLLVLLAAAFAVVLLATGCSQQAQQDDSGAGPAERNASEDYSRPTRTWSG